MLRKVIFGVLFSSLLFSVSADAGRNGIGVTACQQIGSGPPFTGDGSAYCTSYTYFNDLTQGYNPQQQFSAINAVLTGGTHSQSMTINTSTFPAATSWTWTWPAAYSGGSPYAFYEVVLGDSGGYTVIQGAGHPLATQLSKISTLTSTFNLSYTDPDAPCLGGSTGNTDIIFDLWLTSVPYVNARSNPNQVLFEIEIILHNNFTPSSATTFTITEGARTWTAYKYPGNVGNDQRWVVTTGSDVIATTLDINAILKAFTTNGVTTGNEYIAGIPLGVEMYCNTGTFTVNSLSYQWNN